jgi:peroxiredoxin
VVVAAVVAVVVASRGDGTRTTSATTSAPPPLPKGAVGRGALAPDFELTTLDGARVRLSSFHGRPVVVNFWASWCAPCRKEFRELRAAYARHRADGLVVLGVVSWNDIPSDARDFVREQKAAWPMPLDAAKAAENAYTVPYLPQTFFVDRAGRIQLRVYAQLTDSVLADGLRRIL